MYSDTFRDLVSEWLEERYECLKRASITEDLVDYAKGIGKFHKFKEHYAMLRAADVRYAQTPALFWDIHASGALSELAVSWLCIHPITAPAERDWSTRNFVASDLRKILGPDKISKLVYIYVNYRPLDKVNRKHQLLEGSLDNEDTDSSGCDGERGENVNEDEEDVDSFGCDGERGENVNEDEEDVDSFGCDGERGEHVNDDSDNEDKDQEYGYARDRAFVAVKSKAWFVDSVSDLEDHQVTCTKALEKLMGL